MYILNERMLNNVSPSMFSQCTVSCGIAMFLSDVSLSNSAIGNVLKITPTIQMMQAAPHKF